MKCREQYCRAEYICGGLGEFGCNGGEIGLKLCEKWEISCVLCIYFKFFLIFWFFLFAAGGEFYKLSSFHQEGKVKMTAP